ncbi:TIM-barrel domain-containing protein [Novosphingobium terrae]|uniref:TIM-barrel domain-containing protein n=1 Tax=Novosphingobium terrae TaxID=2726189 RepID=UPI0019804351|nr:TIM-barrel domain-containing protein [Novosphingobium terrae]
MNHRMPACSRRAVLSSGLFGASAGVLPAAALAAAPSGPPTIAPTAQGDLHIHLGGQRILLRISAQGVASVVKSPASRATDDPGFFLDRPALKTRIEDTGTAIRLIGPGIIAQVDKASGFIAFLDPAGHTRIAEASAPAPLANTPITMVQAFAVTPGESLHGLGQFRDPDLDYQGRQIFLQHANMDAVNPFLVSTGGWGLLWDTGTGSYLRAQGSSLVFDGIAGDVMRYHVMVGDGMDALIGGYRRLTGQAQLLGKWAYGYWQSKERYQSRAEVEQVVDSYRAQDLPLDNIVLDWRYWGENDQFSGMRFDPEHFPDPKAMIDHIHGQGAHIIASIWPAFGTGTQIYRDMDTAGHLLPDSHWSGGKVFDVTAPDARAIYWRHIDKGLMSIGMDGLWTDGCEPEFMSTGNRYVTARSFASNGDEAAGPIVRNLLTYSYYQSRGLSEAMRRDYPERRPFILTRSVYPGQQAFGAVTWSGDIFASWQTLRNQVVAALNMALSGHPHWTCDIGGFLVFHRYPDGLADPAYKELYVRWFQWGAFLPVFRAHGTDVPRELWQFGKPGEPVFDALAAALRQRYALMPYIYSLAAAAARHDDTMMRALVMDYPHDGQARAQTAQYSFGRDLMVRVVDRPLYHASRNAQEFIPNECIRGMDSPAADVAFYAGDHFDTLVTRDRTDDLKMSWFGDLPRALRGKPYSIRWTGRIRAQETGQHEFVVTAQGAVRLVLAGAVRVDATGAPVARANDVDGGVSARVSASDRQYRFTMDLEAGRDYDFVLEQRQATPDAVSLWVEWITPTQRALGTIPAAKTVPAYLPQGHDWYDLASLQRHRGGQTVDVDAPLAHMPLFARSGAIIPRTPGITRAMQAVQTMEIHVFAGQDGHFELYDDAGDGDGYRHGACAIVPLTWDDRARSLRIGERAGHFPGMAEDMSFTVLLHEGHGAPLSQVVPYSGSPRHVRFGP